MRAVMSEDIYVIAEAEGRTFGEISFELTSEASRLVKKSKGSVHALIVGGGEGLDPEEIVRFGAHHITWLRPEDEKRVVPWDYIDLLKEQLEDTSPALTLAGMTPTMQDILAPLAIRTRSSLLTNVHFIKLDSGGRVVVTRPFCEGRASVQEAIPSGSQVIIAVPVGIFNVQSSPRRREVEVEIVPVNPETCNGPRRIGFIPGDPKTIDIAEAEMIVSGGAGVGSEEDFQKIRELADAMRAAVAGTREARNKGWITRERQIGQTGKEVKPKLIISCGVSGAMAHLAGMKDAEKKLVINTDKNAPIFKYADFGVIGDLRVVIPELVKLLRQ
jgi:electron transfer flavoprotein alpha subunit